MLPEAQPLKKLAAKLVSRAKKRRTNLNHVATEHDVKPSNTLKPIYKCWKVAKQKRTNPEVPSTTPIARRLDVVLSHRMVKRVHLFKPSAGRKNVSSYALEASSSLDFQKNMRNNPNRHIVEGPPQKQSQIYVLKIGSQRFSTYESPLEALLRNNCMIYITLACWGESLVSLINQSQRLGNGEKHQE